MERTTHETKALPFSKLLRLLHSLLDSGFPPPSRSCRSLLLAATLSPATFGAGNRHLLVTCNSVTGNKGDVALTPGC